MTPKDLSLNLLFESVNKDSKDLYEICYLCRKHKYSVIQLFSLFVIFREDMIIVNRDKKNSFFIGLSDEYIVDNYKKQCGIGNIYSSLTDIENKRIFTPLMGISDFERLRKIIREF